MMRSVVWFRKGLRLSDNVALDYCLKNGSDSVLCIFVLDSWHLKANNLGHNRFEFLMQSLRDLDANLKRIGLSGLIFMLYVYLKLIKIDLQLAVYSLSIRFGTTCCVYVYLTEATQKRFCLHFAKALM